MRELLIATSNAHKIEEIQHALAGAPFKLLSLEDVGLENLDVDEPADTLQENAIIKAKEYGTRARKLTVADDTGLFVDALDGRPGVKSARYAPTPEERNRKLLEELKDVPQGSRGAEFRCSLAVFDPATQNVRTTKGSLRGEIFMEVRAGRNFGYDPIFLIPELGKTYAELSIEEKNAISHRGKALKKVRDMLLAEFN
jgi:XTP/dITP diphosphohydrolase